MTIQDGVEIYNEDCLEGMKRIPDKSIDMILCDLPYGTTACKWDTIIPFEPLWEQYERIIKDDGAIALFASGSFTYKVMASNEKLYRYKWIWYKNKRGNFVNAKNRPMTAYEEILMFSKGATANGANVKMKYYPQGLFKCQKIYDGRNRTGTVVGKRPSNKAVVVQEYENYPCDVLEFECVANGEHTSQKPTELLEYLIKTYTNIGETVLDNCMGSGSTGVACIATGRKFIGFELEKEYFEIAKKRMSSVQLSIDGIINI